MSSDAEEVMVNISRSSVAIIWGVDVNYGGGAVRNGVGGLSKCSMNDPARERGEAGHSG